MRLRLSKRIGPGLYAGVSVPVNRSPKRRQDHSEQKAALRATRPRGLWWVIAVTLVSLVLTPVAIPLLVLDIPLLVAVIVMLVRWLLMSGKWRLEQENQPPKS